MKTHLITTDGELDTGTLPPIDANGYQDVWLAANGLSGAEEVLVYVLVGTTWQPLYDEQPTQRTPVAVVLNATRSCRNLIGNASYAFYKSITSGDVELWYSLGVPNPR